MTTNEFERDLDDQASLKRPGRVDMRVFQNTPDAGDGHPGVQRCFRNYLHEGGIEKNIQLLGFGILGDSVDINNAELQQLSLIGGTTISAPQWVFVGEADQALKQADSPTFVGLTLSADLVTSSTIDSVNISDFKTDYDSKINQDVRTTFSPTFVGLTLSANVVTISTFDGVDVSAHTHSGAGQGGTVAHSSTSGRTTDSHHNKTHVLSGGDHTASGLTAGYVIRAATATTFAWQQLGHGDLSAIGSNTHSVIDTHLGSSSNPHTVALSQAFSAGKVISGANSEVNAFTVGGGGTNADLSIWGSSASIIIQSDEALKLAYNGGGSGKEIDFWYDGTDNVFGPTGDTDLGNDANYWRDIYYCNFVDKTCADFRDFSSDNIYNILNQIQPMTDGVLHYSKSSDKYFPHIDFLKLPDELAAIAREDHTIKMYKDIVGVKTEYNVNFKQGDKAGIDFGSLVYMMKDLVLKSYEKIGILEEEIEVLKQK